MIEIPQNSLTLISQVPEPSSYIHSSEPTDPSADGIQILIPLYSYPNWYDPDSYIWDDVATANSRVPITAIINPCNEPDGCPPNDDYRHGLEELRKTGVTILLIGFCSAFHKVSFACIYIQLSGDVNVALAILTAMSGLTDALQLSRADKVFRVTPKWFGRFSNCQTKRLDYVLPEHLSRVGRFPSSYHINTSKHQ